MLLKPLENETGVQNPIAKQFKMDFGEAAGLLAASKIGDYE